MLGLINNVVEAFVTDTFGEETWLRVLSESGQAESYPWVSTCPFSDKITYDLVITAANMLGVTVAYALEAFGTYFVSFITKNGYSNLLKVLGADIVELLDNLNMLHAHLSLAYPDMHAPDFRCENMTPESTELHYYSHRPALGPIVIGILKGMATDFFKFELSIELLKTRDDGHDHEVFLLKFPPQESILNRMAPTVPCSRLLPAPYKMKPEVFCELHPFHILFNRNFIVIQVGKAYQRLLPSLVPGIHLAQAVDLKRPQIQFVWEDMTRNVHGPFLLTTRNTGLQLKGQMVPTSLPIPNCPVVEDIMLFLGSPHCATMEGLQEFNLKFGDMPIHKMSLDYAVLGQLRKVESDIMTASERVTLELKAEQSRSKAVIARMASLLSCAPSQGTTASSGQHIAGIVVGSDKIQPSGPVHRLAVSGNSGSTGQSSMDMVFSASSASNARDRMEVIEAVRRAMGPASISDDLDSQLELVSTIGEGTYGKVYKGVWQGSDVAVKTIVIPGHVNEIEKKEKSALVEAAISASLSHPNIVQTFTYNIRPLKSDSSEAITNSSLIQAKARDSVAEMQQRPGVGFGRVSSPSNSGSIKGPPDSPDPAPNGRFPSPHNSPSSGRQPPKLSTSSSSIDPVGRTHFSRRSLESRHAQRPHWRTSGAGASSNHGGPLFGGTPRSSLPDRSRSGAPSSHQAPHCGSKGAASLNPTSGFEIRLVLEYCNQGCLRDYIDRGCYQLEDGTLNYKGVVDTAMDAARAMIYIHKSGIVHADLKARNVLLKGANDKGKGFIAKVADFGLSAKLEPRETKIYGSCKGTLTHMAPELMLEGRLSKASDVYAFGIMLWELYTGGTPYLGIPNSLLGHHVVKLGKRPEFPPGCHSGYVNLAKLCWTGDFAVRPVFEEVLQALHTIRKTLQEPSS